MSIISEHSKHRKQIGTWKLLLQFTEEIVSLNYNAGMLCFKCDMWSSKERYYDARRLGIKVFRQKNIIFYVERLYRYSWYSCLEMHYCTWHCISCSCYMYYVFACTPHVHCPFGSVNEDTYSPGPFCTVIVHVTGFRLTAQHLYFCSSH